MTKALSNSHLIAFMNLAAALSPENLFADGEVTRRDAAKKAMALKKKWAALEATVGFSVSEDEVWAKWNAGLWFDPVGSTTAY